MTKTRRRNEADLYRDADTAAEHVADRLRALNLGDIAEFTLSTYSKAEIREYCPKPKDRNWVGQYVPGSVDSSEGARVLLAVEAHEGVHDMTDTIAHEMGHALWELVDAADQAKWLELAKDERWGALESFADHLMHLVNGNDLDASFAEEFKAMIAVSPADATAQ